MSMVLMNASNLSNAFVAGNYTIITRMGGGTATLKIRFPSGNATAADFSGGVLAEGAITLDLPNCILDLTQTGAAYVELDINR